MKSESAEISEGGTYRWQSSRSGGEEEEENRESEERRGERRNEENRYNRGSFNSYDSKDISKAERGERNLKENINRDGTASSDYADEDSGRYSRTSGSRDKNEEEEEEDRYVTSKNRIQEEEEEILNSLPSTYSKSSSSNKNIHLKGSGGGYTQIDEHETEKMTQEKNPGGGRREGGVRRGVLRYSDLATKTFDDFDALETEEKRKEEPDECSPYPNFNEECQIEEGEDYFSEGKAPRKGKKQEIFACGESTNVCKAVEEGVIDTALTLGSSIVASFMVLSIFARDVLATCGEARGDGGGEREGGGVGVGNKNY